jgi:hypothetical protein
MREGATAESANLAAVCLVKAGLMTVELIASFTNGPNLL